MAGFMISLCQLDNNIKPDMIKRDIYGVDRVENMQSRLLASLKLQRNLQYSNEVILIFFNLHRQK